MNQHIIGGAGEQLTAGEEGGENRNIEARGAILALKNSSTPSVNLFNVH